LTGTDALDADIVFSLWKMPGHKMLLHDGVRLLLTAQINHKILRIVLDASVHDGCPFALVLPARRDMRTSLLLAPRVVAIVASSRRPRRAGRPRPNRQMMTHLRSLQALDGEAAGASHREIAEAIFGAQDVFERWSTDSELRAQIRYLLRRGHDLTTGGYRRLYSSARREQGESAASPDSP
jgi:hypothetical protein